MPLPVAAALALPACSTVCASLRLQQGSRAALGALMLLLLLMRSLSPQLQLPAQHSLLPSYLCCAAAGRLYFTSPSVAPTDFTDPFTGQRLGTVTIDTSRPGNVIVDTASPPGQLPAARIRATSRGEPQSQRVPAGLGPSWPCRVLQAV